MTVLLSVPSTSGEDLSVELRYDRVTVDLRLDRFRCVWIGGPWAEVFDRDAGRRVDRFRVNDHTCSDGDVTENLRQSLVAAFINWWDHHAGPSREVLERRVGAIQDLLDEYPPLDESATPRGFDRFDFGGRWIGIAENPHVGRYVMHTAATREACLKSMGVERTIWGVRLVAVVDLDTGIQFAAA